MLVAIVVVGILVVMLAWAGMGILAGLKSQRLISDEMEWKEIEEALLEN